MTTPDRDINSTYGAPLVNYSPVIDPTVDLDAGAYNRLCESAAQLTQTGCRAMARFTPAGAGTPVLAASGTAHMAMWGSSPGVAPVPSRSAQGVILITWPTSVNDGLGVAHSPNFIAGWSDVEGATFWTAQVSVSANVATVNLFDTSRTLQDPTGITFAIFVM